MNDSSQAPLERSACVKLAAPNHVGRTILMTLLRFILHPGVLDLLALFLSIVWMLRDERDKTRPLLVIALVLNLFYGSLLTFVMGKENGLVPWKYDHVLHRLDQSLGLSASAAAAVLQGSARVPLLIVYQLMVPMMIVWFLVTRQYGAQKSLILAYVTELVVGPMLYALVPGCGPRYAFGAHWLHPSVSDTGLVRLSGMPNAFPSLHIGTAAVFVFLARETKWRALSLGFFALTVLATLSTGEHYAIDLVAGLTFGCFAAALGARNLPTASLLFLNVLAWSLSVRFAYGALIAHPVLLQSLAALSAAFSAAVIWKQWKPTSRAPKIQPRSAPEPVSPATNL